MATSERTTSPLDDARRRVRDLAEDHGHALGFWRLDPDRPGALHTLCHRCGAGASIHRATAQESISDALRLPCRRPVLSMTLTKELVHA